MSIYQLVHTLNYGDAISNEVLTIDRLLKENNQDSKVVSLHTHQRLKGRSIDFDTIANVNLKTEDNLILHYSLGSKLNAYYLNQSECRKINIFHNLTPIEWFEGYNPVVVENLKSGFNELKTITNNSTTNISDSSFNSQQLFELTGVKSEVLPLPFDHNRFQEERNSGVFNNLKAPGRVNFLHVGRIAPNKKIEDIIKAFYFYHHKINRNSRLWLVGHWIDTELYYFELKRLIQKLMLNYSVSFCGAVSDSELRSYYEASDVYLCMSEHEGFCVPLIEAFYYKLPVIAYSSTAITETVGDGGILIKTKNPGLISELMNELISNSELRSKVIDNALKRLNEYSIDSFKKRLQQIIK